MIMKYLSDLSMRHADKKFCPATGAHRFLRVPAIEPKLWAKVNNQLNTVNDKRLLLSRVDGAACSKAWGAALAFFYSKYETHPSMGDCTFF